MTSPLHLLIMAGGASSRMKKSLAQYDVDQSTKDKAQKHHKCLIPLGEKKRPLLYYHLRQAKKIGVNEVTIITPMDNGGFTDFLATGMVQEAFGDLKIKLVQQDRAAGAAKPLGTADAIQQAMDKNEALKEHAFVVLNGDNLYSIKSLQLLFSSPEKQNALIGYDRNGLNFPTARIQKFAVLQTDTNHYLQDILEKPTLETVEKVKDHRGTIRVSMNIFRLYGPTIYPYLKRCPIHPERHEKELPTAVKHCVQDNPTAFLMYPLCEHVPDLTAVEDIAVMATQLD